MALEGPGAGEPAIGKLLAPYYPIDLVGAGPEDRVLIEAASRACPAGAEEASAQGLAEPKGRGQANGRFLEKVTTRGAVVLL